MPRKDNFLANLSIRGPAEHVFEDYFGVRRYPDVEAITSSRIWVIWGFFDPLSTFWEHFRCTSTCWNPEVGTLKFRVNRYLGISVSPYTEIILKNVHDRLKDLPDTLKVALQAMICDKIVCGASVAQVQSNPRFKLWLATKSSSGHERVEIHRNSSRKRDQRVDKPPRYTQIREEVIFWASACRCPLQHS